MFSACILIKLIDLQWPSYIFIDFFSAVLSCSLYFHINLTFTIRPLLTQTQMHIRLYIKKNNNKHLYLHRTHWVCWVVGRKYLTSLWYLMVSFALLCLVSFLILKITLTILFLSPDYIKQPVRNINGVLFIHFHHIFFTWCRHFYFISQPEVKSSFSLLKLINSTIYSCVQVYTCID